MKVALSVPYCQEMDHIGREKLKAEQERRAEYSVKVPQCKGNYFFFTSHVHSNSWLITKYFYIWYFISSSQYLCEVGFIVLYLQLFPVSIRWLQSVRWSQAPCLLVISVLFSLFYKKRTEITSLEVTKQPGGQTQHQPDSKSTILASPQAASLKIENLV